MYAPTAGHEGIVFGGQRPNSQPQSPSVSASASVSASFFWDGPTVVTRERPQSMNKYTEDNTSPKNPHGSSPQPKNRTEIYACSFPGCQRKFVNQAELRNHFDVLHSTDQDDLVSSAFDQQPAAVEQRNISFDLDDVISSPYPISQHSASQDGEKTVKPIPITAATLQALNSNNETDLTHSMHDLSISGSDGHASSVSLISLDTTFSAIEEPEDIAFSDIAEPDAPSISLPARILLVLWAKFLHNFFARNRTTYRQNTSYQATQDQRASDSKPNENFATPSQTPSIASSSRASKRKENFDDDGQDNGRKPPKSRPPRNQMTPENRPLACPFNKYDSFIFGGDASNSAYHVCSTWHDVKTAYLKQHIIRNHCLPEYHCQRCGEDFKNDKDLGKHYRMDPPCELKDIDSQKLMPGTQLELGLRSRNAVSTDRTSYWYRVYDTIFGSEARQRRPVEPYYMGPSHEVLESFLHFSELRIPAVIRQSRQMLNLNPEDYNDQNVQLVRTILQEASQSFMSERRAARPQSLKDIHEQNTPSEEVVDDLGEHTITVKHEKKALVDRSAMRAPEAASHSWSQPTGDFSQSPNQAFHQQSPHISPFVQSQMYDSSTKTIDATLPQTQVGPNGYSHPASFGYPFTAETYDNALFLNDPEYIATLEDPDMYGSGGIDANDISGYGYGEIPYRRERKLP